MELCLQERYAPKNRCFGCGPANDLGLKIRSFADGEQLNATWQPRQHHEAFAGILNGGIIGTLLDCHCNWAAAYHLMQRMGAATPPCTVTANYTIVLKRPTPSGASVQLVARVVESSADRATVEGRLESAGVVTATCKGLFVAVKEGHPAFHRW